MPPRTKEKFEEARKIIEMEAHGHASKIEQEFGPDMLYIAVEVFRERIEGYKRLALEEAFRAKIDS